MIQNFQILIERVSKDLMLTGGLNSQLLVDDLLHLYKLQSSQDCARSVISIIKSLAQVLKSESSEELGVQMSIGLQIISKLIPEKLQVQEQDRKQYVRNCGIILKRANDFCRSRSHHQLISDLNLPRKLLNLLLEILPSLDKSEHLFTRREKSISGRLRTLQTTRTGFRQKSLKKQNNLPPLQRDSKLPSLKLNSTSRPLQEKAEEYDGSTFVLFALQAFKSVCQYQSTRGILVLEPSIKGLLQAYQKFLKNQAPNPELNRILSAALRHLLAQEETVSAFLKYGAVQIFAEVITKFSSNRQISLNGLRILSKLSDQTQGSQKLIECEGIISVLTNYLRIYRTDIHFVIRIISILANLTAHHHSSRLQIYKQGSFADLVTCFEHYASSDLSKKSEIGRMGISMTSWDYKAMSKQTTKQALTKVMRLIANLATAPQIGSDICNNNSEQFKLIIKNTKNLLAKRKEVKQHKEFLICGLNCLANLLFYQKDMLFTQFQFSTLRNQLASILPVFIIQVEQQEITCEGLRVLANLTRNKDALSQILKNRLHQASLILIESSSKEIVYYSLGALINLIGLLKTGHQSFLQSLLQAVIVLLKECTDNDMEIVALSLKIFLLANNISTKLVQKHRSQLNFLLAKFQKQLDLVLGQRLRKASKTAGQIVQCRQLIETLLQSLPKQQFRCPVKSRVLTRLRQEIQERLRAGTTSRGQAQGLIQIIHLLYFKDSPEQTGTLSPLVDADSHRDRSDPLQSQRLDRSGWTNSLALMQLL